MRKPGFPHKERTSLVKVEKGPVERRPETFTLTAPRPVFSQREKLTCRQHSHSQLRKGAGQNILGRLSYRDGKAGKGLMIGWAESIPGIVWP